MEVVAFMLVKNEADIVWATVAHLLDEDVDRVVVTDNASTDGTRDILSDLAAEHPGRIVVYDDPDPAYYQSRKMTAMAHRYVGDFDATDVFAVPVDADECWVAHADRLAVVLRDLPPHVGVVQARLFNHFATALDDPNDPVPYRRMCWRQREPAPLPKVAFRWSPTAVVHQGNHGVDGVVGDVVDGLEVRHLPYRSPEQFVLKARQGAAAYRATDLPYDMGAHWRSYGELIDKFGEQTLIDEVWSRWFHFVSPVDAGLVRDPVPWRRWG